VIPPSRDGSECERVSHEHKKEEQSITITSDRVRTINGIVLLWSDGVLAGERAGSRHVGVG